MSYQLLLLIISILGFAHSEFILITTENGYLQANHLDASLYCLDHNYILASPTTEELAAKFSQFLEENEIDAGWMDLTDFNSTGRYKWFTLGILATYYNWHDGQPADISEKIVCAVDKIFLNKRGWSSAHSKNYNATVVCQTKLNL